MIYPITTYLLILLAVWLLALSVLTIRVSSRLGKITKDGKTINLVAILENILEKQNRNEKVIATISQQISNLQSSSSSHLQKMQLVRFNPFEDTGGDQSFIVALLDGNNNGFVMSSLHSRNSTRVYAKPVEQGKASEHQFSKEEKEVVEKAARHNS